MKKSWKKMGVKKRRLYEKAVTDLYGLSAKSASTVAEAPLAKVSRPKTVNLTPLERVEQTRLAAFLDKAGYLWCASANGGSRHNMEAISLKRQGVKPGHPDIAIYEPRGKCLGMFIELKRQQGGCLTDQQEWWLIELRKKGYHALCCKGAGEAIEEVQKYMKGGDDE